MRLKDHFCQVWGKLEQAIIALYTGFSDLNISLQSLFNWEEGYSQFLSFKVEKSFARGIYGPNLSVISHDEKLTS